MIAALAGSTLVRALALTLLHFLWQGAAIAAALALFDLAARRAAPAVRYAAACAALALMAIAPPVTFWILSARLAHPAPAWDAADLLSVPAAPSPLAHLALLLTLGWLTGALLQTAER
jgi:hypothetical protein